MELTREGIQQAVEAAERRFGSGNDARALRLGMYWAQECRMNDLPKPDDDQIRTAAALYCELWPPEPPASAKDVRYWLRIGLGKHARTESVAMGLPALHAPLKKPDLP